MNYIPTASIYFGSPGDLISAHEIVKPVSEKRKQVFQCIIEHERLSFSFLYQ